MAVTGIEVLRERSVRPGAEQWWLDGEGLPVVALSHAGVSPRGAEHLRAAWAQACEPEWADVVGTDPQVTYMTCDVMQPGRLVRLRLLPGRVVGTVDVDHVHPATAAALGPLLEELFRAVQVAAA